jgi:predicted aspartyl protease
MITGVVESDEGRIRLTVQGTDDRTQEVEAIVDSGYTASLTLPSAVIAALGLRWQTMDTALLADGSECIFSVYEGPFCGMTRHCRSSLMKPMRIH